MLTDIRDDGSITTPLEDLVTIVVGVATPVVFGDSYKAPPEEAAKDKGLTGEGSMQQKIQESMDICTNLQRQHSLMTEKIQSQDLEITQLKTRIKTLEESEKRIEGFAKEDAPNTGGMDQGEDLMVEKSSKKGSDNTNEAKNVLGTIGGANILASGGLKSIFTTASTAVSLVVATASGSFPTATIFTTVSVATPTTRVTRSSRGVVIEPSSPISVNIPSISKEDKGKGIMTEPE
ncbi:hypothetical protein Tco_0474948 [Tanacetum coccineum]